jgi:hypothetical protein
LFLPPSAKQANLYGLFPIMAIVETKGRQF